MRYRAKVTGTRRRNNSLVGNPNWWVDVVDEAGDAHALRTQTDSDYGHKASNLKPGDEIEVLVEPGNWIVWFEVVS